MTDPETLSLDDLRCMKSDLERRQDALQATEPPVPLTRVTINVPKWGTLDIPYFVAYDLVNDVLTEEISEIGWLIEGRRSKLSAIRDRASRAVIGRVHPQSSRPKSPENGG